VAAEKCPGCGREALKAPVRVCEVCHREVHDKKFGSRAKGNKFEVDLAKAFSEWWGEEKSFRRTPLSGAWDKRAGGDLVTPPEFQFTVEAKHTESWEFYPLFLEPKVREGKRLEPCELEVHWRQALRETTKGKRPLLVFTKNRWPIFYMMTVDDWRGLKGLTDKKTVAVLMKGDVLRVVGLLEDLLAEWKVPR